MAADDEEQALFGDRKVSKDVKRKVLAEKKAHEVVKQLLERNITESFFAESVFFLTPNHYQDVVEERSILETCGYPLCDKELTNIPKQQFRISANKVYDLTHRKNFCSNRCYKASNHVKEQVQSTPLWLRNADKIVPITLDYTGTGMKGDEVPLIPTIPEDDLPTELDKDSSVTQGTSTSKKVRFESNLPREQDPLPSGGFNNNVNPALKAPSSATSSATKKATTQTNVSATQHMQLHLIFDKLEQILREWITKESLILLGYLEDKKQQDAEDNEETADDALTKERKLKLLEERLDKVVLGDQAKPTSRQSRMSESETRHVYEQRVDQFYKGQLDYREKVRSKEVKPKQRNESSPVHLCPHVDSKNQNTIRRKILHQKLSNVFQEMLPSLNPSVSSHDLKQLVASFSLTSCNVVLKTNEYPLMAILLLELMSHSNDDAMATMDESRAMIDHFLSPFNLNITTIQASLRDNIGLLLSHLSSN